MRLDAWRKDERLVMWATELFNDPRWQLLMKTMNEEHPKNYEKPDGSSADRELGVIYGYDRFENNLRAAADPIEAVDLPEATFAPVEPSEPEEN